MAIGSRTTTDARDHGAELQWEALYDAHADDLARFLRRVVADPDTAADLMQDTFVRAMRAGNRPPAAEIRPWLFRIASNLALSHLRRPRWLDLLAARRQQQRDPRFEDAEQVRQAMRAIPADHAVTLSLAYHEGFSRREIAEMLAISEETVKSRIARGRLNFAAAYRRLERGLAS